MKRRITPYRGVPDPSTPIGRIYKHIRDTQDVDGVFSIEPLLGHKVFDAQSKVYGHLNTKQMHNKIDVLRKKHGMVIEKVPEKFKFRVVSPTPLPDPRIELLDTVGSFFGNGMRSQAETLVDILLSKGYRKVK